MNEPLQEGLREALGKLRSDAAGQSAPAALEAALTDAFRAHHSRRRSVQRLWIPGAAVAAALTLAFLSPYFRPSGVRPSQSREPVAHVEKAPAPVSVESAEPIITPAAVSTAKRGFAAKKSRRSKGSQKPMSIAAATTPAPEEPFVQIPYAPPFTPYDEGQILRVNMAGSSMRRMGIPVAAQQVQADLLVGNDGLPRAVRLVSHTPTRF